MAYRIFQISGVIYPLKPHPAYSIYEYSPLIPVYTGFIETVRDAARSREAVHACGHDGESHFLRSSVKGNSWFVIRRSLSPTH